MVSSNQIFINNFTAMNRGRKKSILPYIPGYDNNAVLKLVFFLAGAYIMLALTWAVFRIVTITNTNFEIYIVPNISLPQVSAFPQKWWTVFVYGIIHVPNTFMNMLTNMLWLYCFGSVVQMLVGKNHIVPLFLYSIVCGGLFYLGAQYLPGELGKAPQYMTGPQAGMLGMCAAAVTLSPNYRFYLTETFSVPILVVAGIFVLLMAMATGYYLPVAILMAGGALMGMIYVKLLKAGYRPGAWMYNLGNKLESMVTPNNEAIARRKGKQIDLGQQTKREAESRVDEILDKINRKGYNSLSTEEKEILRKAGQQ